MVEFRYTEAHQFISQMDSAVPALVFHEQIGKSPKVRLFAVGDIGLSGKAQKSGSKLGFDALFTDVAPILKGGDIVFGNLEIPFTSQPATDLYTAPLNSVAALSRAGFTILHIANNHIYEHGASGMTETISALRDNDITPLGGGETLAATRRIVRTDVADIRIGWLGCGRTLQTQDADGPFFWEFNRRELLDAVTEARAHVDVLIVSIHIGFMYLDFPSPDQKTLAEDLVGAGAKLVLMHHPHVLQGVKIIDNNVICYSLGNFLFDYTQGNLIVEQSVPLQQEGAIFVFDIDKDGVCLAAALPTRLENNCTVQLSNRQEGKITLDRLLRVSIQADSIDHERMYHEQRAQWHTSRTLRVLAINLCKGNLVYVIGQLSHVRPYHFVMLSRYLKQITFRLFCRLKRERS